MFYFSHDRCLTRKPDESFEAMVMRIMAYRILSRSQENPKADAQRDINMAHVVLAAHEGHGFQIITEAQIQAAPKVKLN